METPAEVQIGEALQVELPHAGPTQAIAVWVRGNFARCEFVARVSKAAVSAALLRAPVQAPPLPSDVTREFSLHSPDHAELPENLEYGSRTVVMISLLVGLATAALFVLALLTFPFSVH